MYRIISIILLSLTIASCSTFKQVQIAKEPIAYVKPKLNIIQPKPLTMLPVSATVRAVGGKSTLTMDSTSFANWLLNNKAIQQYILSQKTIIQSYKDYYEIN